jgi:peptidoglycan hydrolase-like protein with peptidoglycan-binding domain
MRRPITLVAVLASLALFVPAAAQAAPATQHASARAGGCHRTLKHYPVLLPGAHRPAVRTLQCVLNDDGFGPVVVDGSYGPQTRAAVRRVEGGFEGPSPHPGRINNGFWVLLFGQQLPDRNLRFGQHGPAIRTLQRALRAAGGHLHVNANFGTRTRAVVRNYQRSQGVPVTGVVDERTRFFLAMGGVLHHQN